MEIEYMNNNNEIEVDASDILKFLEFRKTNSYKEMVKIMLPAYIFELMMALKTHSSPTISISSFWDDFIDEYDGVYEHSDWMRYMFRELNRYGHGHLKAFISSRVITLRDLTDALDRLDVEELDFNNPI